MGKKKNKYLEYLCICIPQYFKYLLFKNQLAPRKVQGDSHPPFAYSANKEAASITISPRKTE